MQSYIIFSIHNYFLKNFNVINYIPNFLTFIISSTHLKKGNASCQIIYFSFFQNNAKNKMKCVHKDIKQPGKFSFIYNIKSYQCK